MQRPTGVTVIAIFQIAIGVFAILGGLMVFGLGSAVALHRAAFGGVFGGVAGAVGAILGIICLALGVLYIVLGIGMLKLFNWARILTLVFTALAALQQVYQLLRTMTHFMLIFAFWHVIVLAICVLILWYLLQPNVKQAFGEK